MVIEEEEEGRRGVKGALLACEGRVDIEVYGRRVRGDEGTVGFGIDVGVR